MNKNPANFGRKGWELTIYCLAVYFFGFGATGTMNMLAVDLNGQYGWSLTSLYSFQMIGGILCVITYYILGTLYNKGKINLRLGILICGVASAVLIILWAICGNLGLMMFVIVASFTYLVVQAWGRFFNDNHVNNWFPIKKGAVMGWTTIGLPLGSSMGVKIYLWVSAAFGGYQAVYILFCIIFVVLVIWGYFSFRPYPEELGYYPDNDVNMTRAKADALLEDGKRHAANSVWTPTRILRTPQIWVLGLGVAFMEFFACIVNQMMPNLLSLGYAPDPASNMMFIMTCGAAVASVLWGILDLRIGPRVVIVFILACGLIGGIARFTGTTQGVIVSLVCLGAVLGGGPNMTVSVVSTLFGRYDFKNVFGTILAIGTIFAAVGVVVHSAVAEAYGYGTAYLVQGLCCVIGMVFIGIFTKDGFPQRLVEKWRAAGTIPANYGLENAESQENN